MRLRRCDGGLAAWDETRETWVKLRDASSRSVHTKANECEELVRFLGLPTATRAAWAGVVPKGPKAELIEGLVFQPRSFRDAALFVRHMKQAVKGFVPLAISNGHALQLLFGEIFGKSLRLPRLVGPARKPPYYVGNPLTFVGSGSAKWPSHCAWLDYELEVALVMGAQISANPTVEEVERAILEHGAFVLINDFSARDTQADELSSVHFGFVKSKSFCTSIASEVVTADELWQPGDKGSLFGGLKCSVTVNGESWGVGTTSDPRVCSLAEYVKFAALDEGLEPGELLGLGTVPDCCGLECGKWLKPGDTITVECENLGSITNTVESPPADAVLFKDIGIENPVSRLATFFRLVAMAIVVPPLTFVFLLAGAVAALFWSGPKTSPGFQDVTEPGGASSRDDVVKKYD
ncbi:hypothetical protein CTAYLR_002645 [Chrysophaeum taylorii]|uniref:Fumarylacetoacetase-like C-terminal domain-containing protein n=1 Tax=Chrysophaeum taylorii TaxID=2483200 RepID=A0AAD7XN06_9STRA|nr:hypothetical protein CTAYLR_002645 [Chrysophaeum taylorii]